jgi:hypothetical protein
MNAIVEGFITLANWLDHTHLKPGTLVEQIRKLQIAWPMLGAEANDLDAGAGISILKETRIV